MGYDLRTDLGITPYIWTQYTYVPETNGYYDWYETESCVANSIATITEIQHYIKTNVQRRFSPLWVYGNRSTSDSQQEGMYYEQALNNLRNDGIPLYESLHNESIKKKTSNWTVSHYIAPYKSTNYFSYIRNNLGAYSLYLNNYSNLINEARANRISSWECINTYDIELMKTKIQQTRGVILPIETTDELYNLGSSGILSLGNVNDTTFGGHSLVVLGWKEMNGTTYWICQGSWGTSWGDNGICYVPHLYAHAYSSYVLYSGSYGSIPAIPAWTKWSNTIHQDEDFNINYQDWNDFINYIARVYNYNGFNLDYTGSYDPPWWERTSSSYGEGTCYVKSGDSFKASNFNRVRFAIGQYAATGISNKNTGDDVVANDFHILENSINSLR